MASDQRHATAQPGTNPYGTPSATIEPTQPYFRQLCSMAHRRDVLVKNGFVVRPLSEADIDDKKRCRKCNLRCSNNKNKYKPDDKDGTKAPKKPTFGPGPSSHDKYSKPILKCQYHTGRVDRMYWTCCRTHVSAPGCTWAPEHLSRTYARGDLKARHQYHHTPALSSAATTSPRRPHFAVAIDCEMGTAYDGESELIRVTLVDYFTSEILLDSLVYPQVPMQHYNTKWSGVSRQQMKDARDKGKCITGGPAAVRDAVWRWVSPGTVVVGHAVHNDLAALRWIHPLVVDSLLLATAARAEREKREEEEKKQREEEEKEKRGEQWDKEEETAAAAAAALEKEREEEDDGDLISFDALGLGPQEKTEKPEKSPAAAKARVRRKPGGLSLKALTAEMFDRQIQKAKQGHDSLEDALAARDIVHWFVMQNMAEAQAQGVGSVTLGFW
ncbi:putative exonuclease [Colletotrichum sublineola]|uniref:Putative exonuclease n=1 Tax=Colletotrichum sublineola TaxID=1173701 RepID=A0A066WVD6_COLSU|nr:putative exonuclease [Colletotrichum sublineola]